MPDSRAGPTGGALPGSYDLQRARPEFKPWHKPRKQLIRRRHIGELLRPLVAGTGGPVKYLGLPGAELLDIRWIRQEVCHTRGQELLFVGFDHKTGGSGDDPQASIEAAKLKMEHGIDDRSQIINTAFQSLADRDSLAYEQVRSLGDFDIVNLDLCNGLANETPAAAVPTIYKALERLIALQAFQTTRTRRSRPWLLLLTTRIDAQNIDTEAANRLDSVLSANLQKSREFAERCTSRFGFHRHGTKWLLEGTPAELARSRSLALAKWVMRLACDKGMPAALTSAICYTVYRGNSHPDMLSLAFTVEAASELPPRDEYQLALPEIDTAIADECEQAVAALEVVCDAQDADEMLESDPALAEQATDESARLLREAGYSTNDYKSWLNSQNGRR